ncbi:MULTISPECIES: hypothetical protein [Flammeovirga]|uniref:Ig-like domain-containing protein n=1 Tax=Flammeovirga agarivorans TaxID=2726742 RepID=A0A7X8SIU4_9BACT|nr:MULTISPECIES: hypothetical protein [Flammeovirga]NLR91031.1 hypothetical protein [Flammeovirga agarivorans]
MSTLTRIIFLSFFILCSQISFAQTPLDRTRIIYKSGKYTNSTKIIVEIHGTGITQMMASGSPSFEGSRWIRFQTPFNYTLSAGDGTKSVYYKFKDVDGNESKTLMKKIILDTEPPTDIGVKMDVPSNYLTDQNSLKVGVILSAKGAKYYQLGNTTSFHGNKWRLIQDDYVEWELTAGDDGIRKIYARYRDQAGNVSPVVSDEITVDRTAPFAGGIKINDGAKITNRQDRTVNVSFTCRQVDSMIVAQDPKFIDSKWELFNGKKTIKLTDGDGKKMIYVRYKDLAGNQTQTYSASIDIDTQAPQNISLSINHGEKSTTDINKQVTLDIQPDGAKFMMISNSSSFSGGKWQQASTKFENWVLKGETDGMKHVYIRFKDNAGNVSRPIRASIELKRGF